MCATAGTCSNHILRHETISIAKRSTRPQPHALRATPPTQGIFKLASTLAALATPGSPSAATSLFFREKAFWTFGRGQRLGDLRRQVRQYALAMNQVYEVGSFFKNGQYGTLTRFPVPDSERSNPNFHGCLDTNP